MDHVVAAALISLRGQAVLASGDVGAAVRFVRVARRWTQQELADRSGYSQATISRIERGQTRAARDTDVLADLAQVLDVPPAVFGLASQAHQCRTLDGVDRRDVLSGTVALAVTALLPHGVAAAGRIDASQVAQCWTALHRLNELDQHQGGATAYQLSAGMSRRLQDAVRGGSYPPSVGEELRRVTAMAMQQTGWNAYDAGWEQQARQWWLETVHFADLNDTPEARVRALATMALQASKDPGGGPEVVALAHAARTTAQRNEAMPTLLSLLAAREALGHARAGDRAAATSCLEQSRGWLDHGRREGEPRWLCFWGPADLAWHETTVGLVTRDGKTAEAAARAALASADADAFPRNHILYTAGLGSILTRLGQLDEAIAVTSDAVQRADAVRGSGRIVSDLHHTVDLLGKQNHPPARTFAIAAHRLLPTPV
ncbi:MAG: helix-turn-helix domain-containing protein [Pseudonocardiaceae bacterium]